MIYSAEKSNTILERLEIIKNKLNFLVYFDDNQDTKDSVEEISSGYKELESFILEHSDDGKDRITGEYNPQLEEKNNIRKDDYSLIIERINNYEDLLNKKINRLKKIFINNSLMKIEEVTNLKSLSIENMWNRLKYVVENNRKYHSSQIEKNLFNNRVVMVAIQIMEQEALSGLPISYNFNQEEPFKDIETSNIRDAVYKKTQELYSSINSNKKNEEFYESKKVFLEQLLFNLKELKGNEIIGNYLRVFLICHNKAGNTETIIDKIRKPYFDFSNMVEVIDILKSIYGDIEYKEYDDNPDTLIIEGVKTRENPCKYKDVTVSFIEWGYSDYEPDDDDKIIGIITNTENVSNEYCECDNLEYFITLDNTYEIETEAFHKGGDGLKKLEYVKLGANVNSIGDNAFDGCKRLRIVDFNDKLRIIEPYAFYGTGLKGDIYLPPSVESVNASSFYKTKTNKVYIGEDTNIIRDISAATNYNQTEIPDLSIGKLLK